MSSSVSTTNVQGVSAIAAQTARPAFSGKRPALSKAIAASEEHPAAVSFANVVGKTKAPSDGADTPPEMPEKTPDQIRKEALRKFVDEERASGKVVGFFNINPTKRIVEAARHKGEIPKVTNGPTKKKMDSISISFPDARFYVMKRSGEGRDGKPIEYKTIYVSIPMNDPRDVEEFQKRPLIVTEPKVHPHQEWTNEIALKMYTVGLKKTAPAPKFGRAPSLADPMVDVKKYRGGLPDAYNPKMRMPRGFGPLWNVPPESPHGKGRRCAKSGRDRDGNDKGPCAYNLEVVEALLQGNKPPHGWCRFDHFSIHDAGITTPEAYEKILKPRWLETVTKMLEFEETKKAKMEEKVAREERRDVARAAAAPDEDGFSTAISRAGHKTAKSIPKPEKSMKPTSAKTNGFAALAAADSEDEADVAETTITPTSKPEEKVAEAPKTQTQFKGKKKKNKYVKIEGMSF